MRRVHDDDGSGSVEEESISDHPRSLDGGDGGRSALPEEMFRWASWRLILNRFCDSLFHSHENLAVEILQCPGAPTGFYTGI